MSDTIANTFADKLIKREDLFAFTVWEVLGLDELASLLWG